MERLTDAICDAAVMIGVDAPHRPWLDELPALLTRQQLARWLDAASDAETPHRVDGAEARSEAAIGLVDDPAHQRRLPLVWRPGDGNVLLVGAVGSGTTTAVVALARSLLRVAEPTDLHLYVIDARGDDVWNHVDRHPHCGGVIRIGELERLNRVLLRLADEMDRRTAAATTASSERVPQVVVVIDGLAAVRDVLDAVSMTDASTRLDRLLRDGPALGLSSWITTDGSSTNALCIPRSATWVFRLDDVGVARSIGLRDVPMVSVPGRLRVVETGLEAQVVFDAEPVTDVGDGDIGTGGPPRIAVLPDVVDAAALDAATTTTTTTNNTSTSTSNPTAPSSCPDVRAPAAIDMTQPLRLVVGLDAGDLEPAVLCVPAGDHVFVGGGARTGRSTALRQIGSSWRWLHPDGVVVYVDRQHPLDEELVVAPDAPREVEAVTPRLVLVDDADRVDDTGGHLAALIASRAPGVTVAVAARLEAVRVAYGHWTREVARSRCGLIMTSAGDVDGELLGATLPRRSMISPRPGLAWAIDQRGHRLVQVAARMPS